MDTQTQKADAGTLLSNAAPKIGPERRLTPRKDWVADINFEPNNGGIVLNLSEGGLGFRSLAPLEPSCPIRFWFSHNNQRVQACGELVWIDASQKTGGLRFTAMPAEARAQIRHWTTHTAPPLSADAAPAGSAHPLRRFLSLGSIRPDTNGTSVSSSSLARFQLNPRALTPWSWFSGGLAVGLVLSALISSVFIFRTNRRQLGESIIHFGERIEAKAPAQHQSAPLAPAPPAAAAADAISSPAVPATKPAEPISQPLANSVNSVSPPRPQLPKSESAVPAISMPVVAPLSRPKLPTSVESSSIPAAPLPISSPNIAAPSESNLVPGKSNPGPPLEPAKYASAFIEPSGNANPDDTPSEMYFEVGRFKDDFSAKRSKDKLAQLGFPAAVIQKSRFWSNAYRVVVGPYNDDAEAKIGQRSLVSRGFNPQPFERGSRDFNLSYALTLNGKSMPLGDCIIRWESYSTNVAVQFLQGKYVAATADAKWAPRRARYDRPAFVYTKGGDGSRNLAEIRFAGMDRALVFHKLP